MTKPSVLLVYVHESSFVKADQSLLSSFAKVYRYPFKPGKGLWPTALQLIRQLFFLLFRGYRFDTFVVWFGDYHSLLPVLFARLYRKQSLVVIGGYDVASLPELGYGSFAHPIRAFFTRNTFRWASRCLPVAQALENKLRILVPKAKAETLATGTDSSRFSFSNYTREKRVITVSATENHQRIMVKGLDRFCALAEQMPDYEFLLIGASPAATKLLGETPLNVKILPAQPFDQLKIYYQSASFYAQFSRSEGLPNALCEAMLCGCIPLGTAVGDIAPTIGDTGLVLSAWEPDLAAEYIRTHQTDNLLRDRARSRVEGLYAPLKREQRLKELVGYPKRILLLTEGQVDHASTRIRALNYIPFLADKGYHVVHRSRVPQRSAHLFARLLFPLQKRWYATRMAMAIRWCRWDLVFIQRWLIAPALVEKLQKRSIPILFDFDDAIYRSTANPNAENRTNKLIQFASGIVVSTDNLRDYCSQLGREAVVIPSAVETDRIIPVVKPDHEIPTIGWIGSSWTTDYLKLVEEPLQELARRHPFRLLTIGARPGFQIEGVEVVNRPWRLAREQADLGEMDLGIMPLPDDEWTRMKGGYKILQYFAAGIPAVASPVGINRQIIRPDENGFLAADPVEWVEVLERLLTDRALRLRLGIAGRQEAEKRYSLPVCFEKLLKIVDSSTEQVNTLL